MPPKRKLRQTGASDGVIASIGITRYQASCALATFASISGVVSQGSKSELSVASWSSHVA